MTSSYTDVGLKDPSKLAFQASFIRRTIITSYWIVIFLAIPLWWITTSIERLSLDTSRVIELEKTQLNIPINIVLDESGEKSDGLGKELKRRMEAQADRWDGLEVHLGAEQYQAGENTYTVRIGGEHVVPDDRTVSVPSHYTDADAAELLTELLVPYKSAHTKELREVEYAPRYRVAYTLLNEDAASGNVVFNWNIRSHIQTHIQPVMDALSKLHNFTVESQVQFHAPLAFKPVPLEDGAAGVTEEDLTVFVNSAEWTLASSSSNDPVLHFILFASSRPLHILDKEGAITSKRSFLLPQWGGIVLNNIAPSSPTPDFDQIFHIFAGQLLSILGLPKNVRMGNAIGLWQLDALTRRRTLENARLAKETLKSTVLLVDKIENMPVDKFVRGDVQNALDALELMHETSGEDTFGYSAQALKLASRAFFHPGMLGLLYFPAEHKYAVYTPLFASAMIPVVAATLRELAAWKKERKERSKQSTKPDESKQ